MIYKNIYLSGFIDPKGIEEKCFRLNRENGDIEYSENTQHTIIKADNKISQGIKEGNIVADLVVKKYACFLTNIKIQDSVYANEIVDVDYYPNVLFGDVQYKRTTNIKTLEFELDTIKSSSYIKTLSEQESKISIPGIDKFYKRCIGGDSAYIKSGEVSGIELVNGLVSFNFKKESVYLEKDLSKHKYPARAVKTPKFQHLSWSLYNRTDLERVTTDKNKTIKTIHYESISFGFEIVVEKTYVDKLLVDSKIIKSTFDVDSVNKIIQEKYVVYFS